MAPPWAEVPFSRLNLQETKVQCASLILPAHPSCRFDHLSFLAQSLLVVPFFVDISLGVAGECCVRRPPEGQAPLLILLLFVFTPAQGSIYLDDRDRLNTTVIKEAKLR